MDKESIDIPSGRSPSNVSNQNTETATEKNLSPDFERVTISFGELREPIYAD